MRRPYTEQQVLKKLDIPDFRHMGKEKTMALASMIHKMDPEVAKKALEQFPNFASTSFDIIKEYRGALERMLDDEKEDANTVYDAYFRIMDSLEKMLETNDLTFEQKTYIIEQMKTVADEISKKDKEKTITRLKYAGMFGGMIAGTVITLASALGSNMLADESETMEDDDI